jgi:hypothetical protein
MRLSDTGDGGQCQDDAHRILHRGLWIARGLCAVFRPRSETANNDHNRPTSDRFEQVGVLRNSSAKILLGDLPGEVENDVGMAALAIAFVE